MCNENNNNKKTNWKTFSVMGAGQNQIRLSRIENANQQKNYYDVYGSASRMAKNAIFILFAVCSHHAHGTQPSLFGVPHFISFALLSRDRHFCSFLLSLCIFRHPRACRRCCLCVATVDFRFSLSSASPLFLRIVVVVVVVAVSVVRVR